MWYNKTDHEKTKVTKINNTITYLISKMNNSQFNFMINKQVGGTKYTAIEQ